MADIATIRFNLRADAVGSDSQDAGPTYTLVDARCVLGYVSRDTKNGFLRDLLTDGPYLLIGPGGRVDQDIQSHVSAFDIPCDLWLGIDRETNDQFRIIEGLLEDLSTNWFPHIVRWERPNLDTNKDPVIVHYKLSVSVISC